MEGGRVFREAWEDELYGCPDYLLRGHVLNDDHVGDANRWRRAHTERVRCPVCAAAAAPEAQLPSEYLVALARRTSRSLSDRTPE